MADEPKGYGYGGLPGAPEQTINFPQNTGFVVFQVFETLNTKPPRPAIQDSEMSWCDGFMPFGPSNLRTLYGVGDTLYTVPNGVTVNSFRFYNFAETPYMAVLRSDGGLDQVNALVGTVTTIMAPGTIQNPNPHNTSATLWSSKYFVIVSSQDNGFWLWDGTTLFGTGGISPETAITNSGDDYTSPPTVTFYTTATSYVAPTFTPVITNGFLTELEVNTPGSGFTVDDLVAVAITGGGTDSSATANAVLSPNTGQVTEIAITLGASGLSGNTTVTLTGGGGTGATAAVLATGGSLQSITVTNGGRGYTSPPTVVFSNMGTPTNTPTATAILSFGEIPSLTLTDAGSGYKSPPVVNIVGDGTGAQASAQIDNSGAVTGFTVTNPGYGYSKAIVMLSGGNKAAEATVSLMPTGIQGTTVETYVNRVWVGDEKKGYFTAPSSPSDFTPSNGAGAFQSTDSFQRVSYSSFRQTNGFLYLISDSSLNYIGGVQISSGSSTPVFNNLNVDPQIGTPWPSTVQLFSRNIVFANSFGIFVSYGGAVTKISSPLDGIYNTVISPGASQPLAFPSSASAALFGIAVYMLLFPIIDPYTGQQVNKLLIWDGRRWFTSSQDATLTYIASQEINSVLTAWGTDGTEIFPLFQTPSTGFQKVAQSKLWANPSYWFKKSNPYLAGILNFNNSVGTVTVTVDSELGSNEGVSVEVSSSGLATWINASGNVVSWINAANTPVVWGSPGLALIEPVSVGQVGTLMGMTVTTEAEDVSILSISLLQQNFQYRGG